MPNLDNINRLTKDIVVYDSFLTAEESEKIIKVLDATESNGTITWMPISFYESYSSVLPHDGDSIIEQEGLPSDIFSKIKSGIIDAVASVHNIDPKTVVQIGYHTQKWEKGAYATIHADNSYNDGTPSPFERSRYATFIYLNENFFF